MFDVSQLSRYTLLDRYAVQILMLHLYTYLSIPLNAAQELQINLESECLDEGSSNGRHASEGAP